MVRIGSDGGRSARALSSTPELIGCGPLLFQKSLLRKRRACRRRLRIEPWRGQNAFGAGLALR